MMLFFSIQLVKVDYYCDNLKDEYSFNYTIYQVQLLKSKH